jgi:predicted GIY-YIG superfamily endonuclease
MTMLHNLHDWQGESGRWYVHSISTFGEIRKFGGPANYVFARRNWDGTRVPLYIGQTQDLSSRMTQHLNEGLVNRAVKLGLNEVHVHFLGKHEAERFRIETDLRNGHVSFLNQQPSRARLHPQLQSINTMGRLSSPQGSNVDKGNAFANYIR